MDQAITVEDCIKNAKRFLDKAHSEFHPDAKAAQSRIAEAWINLGYLIENHYG